jgi:hypothetical protein
MVIRKTSIDEDIKNRLISYSSWDKDYWSFRGKAVRKHAHAYLQYPAMMVPQIQGELIQVVRDYIPGLKSVYDPFAGSGTVMTESMLQGLDFTGQDINPLAVLICKAKKGPFFEKALMEKKKMLLEIIANDNIDQIEIEFPNILKWFRQDVARELSRIRRAIKKEPSLWARRFFWVVLAETIRLSSNSRTSTFKLHIRPKDEINGRNISPTGIFNGILQKNYEKLTIIKSLLNKSKFLINSHFRGFVDIKLADSRKMPSGRKEKERFDLLVTSPPYGDNVSTVPYGQYSYLPLQWIDGSDIDDKADQSFLFTTHEIDKRSLGGIKRSVLQRINELEKMSESFSHIIKSLKNEPMDRTVRVAAFCRDLNECIEPILSVLNPGAFMIWTIGNRRVGKKIIRMDDILSEFLMARGARKIVKLERIIPSKRMAVKNSISNTMRKETILVFKKGDS